MSKRFTRRDFLTYSLASGVTIWTAHEFLNLSSNQKQLFAAETPTLSSPFFPQSVASGDPQPNGITLWTRVAPQGLGAAVVSFQVAQDPQFKAVVLAGTATTDAAKDYTVKVQVANTGLRSNTTYYYRFIYNNNSSRTGRFKTLPEPDANISSLRFAYISCQDYTNGLYTALKFLADENVDFVVHLGDYIYEQIYGGFRQVPPLPSGNSKATTIEDYRHLYKVYRSDPDLQLLHERCAFITIWDDHEFANDGYQDFSTDTQNASQNQNPVRRQAANQAWAEYTPAAPEFSPNQGPTESIKIYRSFVFGRLMELVMTDERLYRDGPPCGLQEQPSATSLEARYFTPGCANLANPSRSMLGQTQRDWFLNKITQSTRQWKFWGNEVMTMQFKIKAQFSQQLLGLPLDLFFSLDEWDGYPVERQRIFTALKNAGVKNFVTLTGDLHTFIAGYQRLNFDAPLAPVAFAPNTPPADAIGVEFVVGSVSSSNFQEERPDLPAQTLNQVAYVSNPHFRYFNSATHGYNVVRVSRDAVTVTLKQVSSITDPNATVSTLATFRVPNNQARIES